MQIDGRMYYAHRLVWKMHYGEIPDGKFCIDPVKICSCYKERRSDECDDGRPDQAVDGEAQDGARGGDHPREDDGGRGQPVP
ncbi:HNH endonuclease [Cereibacter sphaeroides]|uniref:HNH endonuclease n=1 Tax=Cereibacter sphaeroides TaxID=1063 RepID=UPI003B585CD8